MGLGFADIIFYILIGISVVLVAIGVMAGQNWWTLFRFGNAQDKESFNAVLWHLWKTSASYISLGLLPIITALIVHMLFRS